jgi:hypothetical protein
MKNVIKQLQRPIQGSKIIYNSPGTFTGIVENLLSGNLRDITSITSSSLTPVAFHYTASPCTTKY